MATHDLAAASRADQSYRLLDGRTRSAAGQVMSDETWRQEVTQRGP